MSTSPNESRLENPRMAKEEFELREKRLNLVYKILYVLAAIWAALFLAYTNNPRESGPVYCGALAVLTMAIIKVIIFIFSELRCLKVTMEVTNQEKTRADKAFSDIWNGFSGFLFTAAVFTLLNIGFPQLVSTQTISVGILILSLAMYVVFLTVKKGWGDIAKGMLAIALCYLFFSVAQISVV